MTCGVPAQQKCIIQSEHALCFSEKKRDFFASSSPPVIIKGENGEIEGKVEEREEMMKGYDGEIDSKLL